MSEYMDEPATDALWKAALAGKTVTTHDIGEVRVGELRAYHVIEPAEKMGEWQLTTAGLTALFMRPTGPVLMAELAQSHMELVAEVRTLQELVVRLLRHAAGIPERKAE